LPEKEIEIKLEISKKAGLLKKPVRFTDVQGQMNFISIAIQFIPDNILNI